ncbi:MAG: hypothetical protein ABIF01_01230 [Candidatus Micrarchaeota archaeon]
MKLSTALLALELVFTAGLLGFVLFNYVSGTPISNDVFLAFVFYPLAILGTVVALSFFISVRFGNSIFAYGVVLGLGISLSIFAFKSMPALLSLGLAMYIINRMLVIISLKDVRKMPASLLADHLVSFQVASLIILAATREYWSILERAEASPVLLIIIIVWYLFTLFYEIKTLLQNFSKWSRSES